MQPFKEGSMKMAQKTGCPIIPMAITNSAEIFENHIPFMRPSQVTIEFGEPIYLKQLPRELKKCSGAYTRERIIEMLKEEQEFRKTQKEVAPVQRVQKA